MHTKPRRPFSKIKLTIALGLFLVLGTIAVMSFLNAIDPFRKLRITIDNQSDYDITQIQAGAVTGERLITDAPSAEKQEKSGLHYTLNKDIPSGQQIKFAPQLKIRGEGSVYVTFQDSRGKNYKETACGYTESLSGTSHITITNENVTVKENCM